MEKTQVSRAQPEIASSEEHYRGKPIPSGRMTITKLSGGEVQVVVTQVKSPNQILRLVSEFLAES